jgi:translation initiation factor IF-3
MGVVPIQQALDMARDADLDLVEVAPNANPPVCRILDYGKFKYEQSKKEREAHKHQKQSQLREVRFRPKIGTHDIDFKTRVAKKLLDAGDKVKVSVMFRGREITHPEIGRDLLLRVAGNLEGTATVEKPPIMEGRFMNMILAPIPAKQEPKPKGEKQGGGKQQSPDGKADAGQAGGEPPDTAVSAAMRAAQEQSARTQG